MLVDVFRCFAPSYIKRFAGRLLASHAWALSDILRCRTPACGGHAYLCADCGERHLVADCGERHLVAHSCRNRHCPTCGAASTEEWLAARRGELLGTGYFHLVFTLPAARREVCRSNQGTAYTLLFQAAYGALQKLADDPRYVGGRLAVLGMLHTWSRALVYHPHIHLLAPAGGLGPDGRWRPSNPASLVPVRALSRLFRSMFLAKLEAALPQVAMPPSVRRKDRVVYRKAAPRGPERVLQYLGRYLRRVAITSARLVGFDQSAVTFRYRDRDCGSWRTMTLAGHEFLRRYLQHVLPRGFHKVRYFGLWHPRHRDSLCRVAAQLALAAAESHPTAGPAQVAPPTATPPHRCPRCGSIRLCCLGHVRPSPRPP